MSDEKMQNWFEGFDAVFLVVLPIFNVVICAIAASQSDTPSKWLLRSAAWLIVLMARTLIVNSK